MQAEGLHDVGQANLWGHGGKKSNTGAGPDGGYFMPVKYVKQVERAQTSHLPDPFDPTPIDRGIGVYYTDLTWGSVSEVRDESARLQAWAASSRMERMARTALLASVTVGSTSS